MSEVDELRRHVRVIEDRMERQAERAEDMTDIMRSLNESNVKLVNILRDMHETMRDMHETNVKTVDIFAEVLRHLDENTRAIAVSRMPPLFGLFRPPQPDDPPDA